MLPSQANHDEQSLLKSEACIDSTGFSGDLRLDLARRAFLRAHAAVAWFAWQEHGRRPLPCNANHRRRGRHINFPTNALALPQIYTSCRSLGGGLNDGVENVARQVMSYMI